MHKIPTACGGRKGGQTDGIPNSMSPRLSSKGRETIKLMELICYL